MVKKIHLRLLIMIIGAISFWAPITAISLITQERLNLAMGTLLPPATFFLGYVLVRGKTEWPRTVRSMSLWMLFGILFFGPWFLGVGLLPTKGGFYHFHGWVNIKVVLLAMVFPILTLMFALSHGTHHGIWISALLSLFLHRRFEKSRNIPDPNSHVSQIDLNRKSQG